MERDMGAASDNHKTKVNVLAVLEAYRLFADAKKERNADHAIRVCQAIIAGVFGFDNRADWIDEVVAAELINYGHDVDCRKQYEALTEVTSKIKI